MAWSPLVLSFIFQFSAVDFNAAVKGKDKQKQGHSERNGEDISTSTKATSNGVKGLGEQPDVKRTTARTGWKE